MTAKEEVMRGLNAVGMSISMLMSGDYYVCDINDQNTMIVPKSLLDDYYDWESDTFHVIPANRAQQEVMERYADELDYLLVNCEWAE